jgi:hypothetical protein
VGSSPTRPTKLDQRKVPNSLAARAGVDRVFRIAHWGLAGFQRGRAQPQLAALDADQRSVVINNKDTHDERHRDRRTAADPDVVSGRFHLIVDPGRRRVAHPLRCPPR